MNTKSAINIATMAIITTTALSSCSTHTQPSGFDAIVSIRDAQPACQLERCWLPTQFTPTLVAGVSVSLFEQWPMDGDTVRVICHTAGGTFRDSSGKNTNEWYGILVPSDKVNPDTKQQAKRLDDGYLAYVGKVWLIDTSKTTPHC